MNIPDLTPRRDGAREMGAEVVIGVTLNGKPKTAEDVTGTMKIVGQTIDVNCVNKYDENKAITDLWMNVDPHGYSTASFTSEAIDSLIRYGEEETMHHWDEIIALKKLTGIDDSFHPVIYNPTQPDAMTKLQRVTGFTFEKHDATGRTVLEEQVPSEQGGQYRRQTGAGTHDEYAYGPFLTNSTEDYAYFGLYLSKHLSLDLRSSYFWRHAHYRDFKDVDANNLRAPYQINV